MKEPEKKTGETPTDILSPVESPTPLEKMRELETLLPGQPKQVYGFGRFLADRIGDDTLPEGLVIAAELATYDLSKGIDGFTGKPINNSLIGYPSFFYRALMITVPMIADVTYPPEFSQQVRDFIETSREQS